MTTTAPQPPTTKLPVGLLEQAATWYVQLQDSDATAADHQHWQHWFDSDERHKQAWRQMQALQRRLQHVPGELGAPTLHQVKAQRRHTIKLLTLLLATGGAAWVGYETTAWKTFAADHRTATGERQRVTLADGGILDINARASVDINYSNTLRLLRLHAGEILVQTAPDTANRPFEVHSAHGVIRALGTRFSVATDSIITRVMVFQDAVSITLPDTNGQPILLHAGQQLSFTRTTSSAITPIPTNADAWTNGKLIVNDVALSDFVASLANYRRGYVLCDPSVANLRISGAFRLDDTDGILANLAASLPVRVRYVTRYWARIEALPTAS